MVQLMAHTISLKLTISKSRHGYHCRKHRYSINTQVVMGNNLQFIDIALVSPRASMIQWCLDILHFIRDQKPMKYC